MLDGKSEKRQRRAKHDFAFSRLIACGHCGCALVGELKKGKYVYYHCTGHKGKCPEPYVREEVLEEKFTEVLKGLAFDEEVVDWISQALRESQVDEKQFRDAAVERLQKDYNRLQNRLDQMYVDKLDGRITQEFFDQKSAEWREEQERIEQSMADYREADQCYVEEGIELLELARTAHVLFEKRPPSEKRKLLDFVVSNSTWKDGELSVTYRQPFDMLAVTTAAANEKKAAGGDSDDLRPIWHARQDSNL